MTARVTLSRLVASGDEPGIGADILASGKAARIFDSRCEGECGDRADARDTHQPGADWIGGGAFHEQPTGGTQLLFDRLHRCDERSKQRCEIGTLSIKRGQALGAPTRRSGGAHAQTEQLQQPAQLVGHGRSSRDQLHADAQRGPVDVWQMPSCGRA